MPLTIRPYGSAFFRGLHQTDHHMLSSLVPGVSSADDHVCLIFSAGLALDLYASGLRL